MKASARTQAIPGAFTPEKKEEPAESGPSSSKPPLSHPPHPASSSKPDDKGRPSEFIPSASASPSFVDLGSPGPSSAGVYPENLTYGQVFDTAHFAAPTEPATRPSSALSARSPSQRSFTSTSSSDSLIRSILKRRSEIPEHAARTPLGCLIQEFLYQESPEDGVSLFSKVSTLVEHQLGDEDIERLPDGQKQGDHVYLFALSTPTLGEVLSAVYKFDDLLLRMANASSRPLEVFKLDRIGALRTTLTRAESRIQIRIAFQELKGRLERGMRYVRRYLSEILEVPEQSPVLSASDLSSLKKDLGNPNTVLRRYILHSNALGLLSSDQRQRLEAEEGTLEDLLPPDYFRYPYRADSRESDELQVDAELGYEDDGEGSVSVPPRVPSAVHSRSKDRARPKVVAFEHPPPDSSSDPSPRREAPPAQPAPTRPRVSILEDMATEQLGYLSQNAAAADPAAFAGMGGFYETTSQEPYVVPVMESISGFYRDSPPHFSRNQANVRREEPRSNRRAPHIRNSDRASKKGNDWDSREDFEQPASAAAGGPDPREQPSKPKESHSGGLPHEPPRQDQQRPHRTRATGGGPPSIGSSGGSSGSQPPSGPRLPEGGGPPPFPQGSPDPSGRRQNPPLGPPTGPSGRPEDGGGDPNPAGSQDRAPAYGPHFQPEPRIKRVFELSQLPSWDGNGDSAIEYFAKVHEYAALGGSMPEQLGAMLWTRFVPGSSIDSWYKALPESDKEVMRSHYLQFLYKIRDSWLGPAWALKQRRLYSEMSFRQKSHEKETPVEFARRRLVAARMLARLPRDAQGNVDPGAEIVEVMAVFPISWRAKLQSTPMRTSADLQQILNQMEKELLHAFYNEKDSEGRQAHTLTEEEIAPLVERVRSEMKHELRKQLRSWNDGGQARRAMAVELNSGEEDEPVDSEDDPIVAEAFAVIRSHERRNRTVKPIFAKSDAVRTKLRRKPPSPCRNCGSPNHWDRECPSNAAFKLMKEAKLAHALETDRPPEQEEPYSRMYDTFVAQSNASAYVSQYSTRSTVPAGAPKPPPRQAHAVTIEEVEDVDAPRVRTDRGSPLDQAPLYPLNSTSTPAAGTARVVPLAPKRKAEPGRAAQGISVLSVRGKLNSLDEADVDLRLDSGADITLISEDFYRSLKTPPRLRTGLKMSLWQLVDKNASIQGYVDINIYVPSSQGPVLKLSAEAYVVPGMAVPILLGEDFQRTYEIGVSRDVALGCRISFGGTEWLVPAKDVEKRGKLPKLARNVEAEASFVRAKASRRSHADRQRKSREEKTRNRSLRLTSPVVVPPQSVVNAEVALLADASREWLVERAIVHAGPESKIAVPNCLVTGSRPRIPISNPTDEPISLAQGTLVGVLTDPTAYFDTPKDLAQLENMLRGAARVAAISEIMETVYGQPGQPPDSPAPPPAAEALHADKEPRMSSYAIPPAEAEPDDDGPWGPKTAEVPDPTVYPSEKMKEILDVGSLPARLEAQAWDMLKRRQGAFSFDGRLGHLATRVHIRTVDGLNPIAVPMYGTSPAKRLVIEEQLQKWFVQDVIEPSKSPWSAPVVIAYRNGKPRFCVDYRKLNAQTISDEFPIPRQSEILAALSGAQVLSSLDALAGFTQMEFEDSEKEKTAFRTHLGLFQFKRMPFGLKNGPSIFQRTMQAILAPFLWLFCLVYIDDIVVYSKSYEDHIQHLDRVLGACEDAGLTLSPAKCHLFYPSVLLLGHKVSRLGLSTHEEKVKAIIELQRPTKHSQLQTFLGMTGYFSAFIPFYSMIATPLFALLKKNTRWHWGPAEDHAFRELKIALQAAPVLGHPIVGRPYRLYSDASDEALGCALQQVQRIRVEDLKGTKHYDRLRKAFDAKQPVPRLVTQLAAAPEDTAYQDEWADTFEDSEVHVERVIGYWSRTFKQAERNYSATEREALGAKEGLIKFQPFVEGERVALITDHAALQWAHTYENANRRLAAWGAVFSAYKPGLVICHRPGRVHSNVDPLSRLPRDGESGKVRGAPDHQSPERDETTAIRPDNSKAATRERAAILQPKEAFWAEEDPPEAQFPSTFAVTRAQAKKGNKRPERTQYRKGQPTEKVRQESLSPETKEAPRTSGTRDEDPFEMKRSWEESNELPPVLVHLSPAKANEFIEGYKKDPHLKARWNDKANEPDSWYQGKRFFKTSDGLLFFRDADYQPRLCVPAAMRNEVLKTMHESPFESAHAGFERTWAKLSRLFYWYRMRKDVKKFCQTCDVCQKVKPRNFTKYGRLLPHYIPARPFESISMDLITGLPMSDGFNAVWVAVDRLSKFALFVPTTTGLDTQGFASLFVKHVAARFGIPESIVTDRDPRWTHDFWLQVSKLLKTEMWLSSSHHPQHDGQTEVVNKQLETMLRAYVSNRKGDWTEFLHLLEHAHNATVNGSTGEAPFFLLYGFHPRDAVIGLRSTDDVERPPVGRDAADFVATLEAHREAARLAIAKAQEAQAKAYNKSRKTWNLRPGDLVLIDPHALQWVESKGEGKKLLQKFIGPFAVQERIGENTYRLDLPDTYPGSPVFNIQHLRPYEASPEYFGSRTELPTTRTRRPESEEFQVEKVIAHRFDKESGAIKFLVRWEGYSPLYDSWLSAKDLRNAPRRLFEYRERQGI